MNKPLILTGCCHADPRGAVAPSLVRPTAKFSPSTCAVEMTTCNPDRTGQARDSVLHNGSMWTLNDVDLTVGDGPHSTREDGDDEAVTCSAVLRQLDVSLDYMPAGVRYGHVPPCDQPEGDRHLHSCLMVDANGEFVGLGHGSTWVKARIDACAQYRRDRIRGVTISERGAVREPA